MAITINRAFIGTNDDGTGATGTVVDTGYIGLAIYDQVDVALALLSAGSTWTPVLGGAGGTSGQTYAVQQGQYIKIGKLVYAFCYIQLSAKGTITGAVEIQGLPIVAANVANQFAPALIPYFNSLATNWVTLGGYIAPNGTVVRITGLQAAAASTAELATADIGNSTILMMSIVYPAAS